MAHAKVLFKSFMRELVGDSMYTVGGGRIIYKAIASLLWFGSELSVFSKGSRAGGLVFPPGNVEPVEVEGESLSLKAL